MSDLATAPSAISAATLEAVLATGDLSKLTPAQRIEYVSRVCQTVGLNPFTRPIRFLRLGSDIVAYFTRDGTDQLRKLHNISLSVTDQRMDGDVWVITVQARTPGGRSDEDIGAVTIGRLQSESKANALMKCITKAKRRVTLSICGLGFMDESELDTLGSIQTFDAGDPTPEPSARASRATDKPDRWERYKRDLAGALDAAASWDAVREIEDRPSMQKMLGTEPDAAPLRIQRDIRAMLKAAYEKLAPAAEQPGASEEETWDPIAELLAEVDQMDAIALADLPTNAEWRAKVNAATWDFPPDAARIIEHIEMRRQSLRPQREA